MKISSKLLKIISILLCVLIVFNTAVLSVSAETHEAGEWSDNRWHQQYEDFSDCPVYSVSDLEYTGELSQNLLKDFNLRQQYDMSFCTDSKFYLSRPFEFRKRWNSPTSYYTTFGERDSAYNKMFTKEKLESLTKTFFENNSNLNLSAYDVYYYVYQNYDPSREYGYFGVKYILVPAGDRVAMANENKPDGSNDWTEVHYALLLPEAYQTAVVAECYINGESGSVVDLKAQFATEATINLLGRAHCMTVATNIPVFTRNVDAANYVLNGVSGEDPTNKIPEDEQKVGADAFFWDSLKCRLTRVENKYKFVFDYSYSVPDMVANPNEYMVNIDYTQTYKYKVIGKSNIVDDKYKTKSTALYLGNSPGSLTDDMNLFSPEACGVGEGFVLVCDEYIHILLGDNRDYTSVTFYNSYITVYVELVHVIDGGNGLSIKDKVSSDIRSFTFDALTLKSLDDTSDIEPVSQDKVEVTTKDTVDSDGNVIDRTVTGSTVINNITNTVNNYYYDSDGNKKESSGSSIGDSLSDIASGLIKFIKTLVTEGLPAALEILKSLIKTISDLLGFIGDQIGDIGQGTQNGIVAVLKAIPVPLWGICSVALIVFVIVGILKHIF